MFNLLNLQFGKTQPSRYEITSVLLLCCFRWISVSRLLILPEKFIKESIWPTSANNVHCMKSVQRQSFF